VPASSADRRIRIVIALLPSLCSINDYLKKKKMRFRLGERESKAEEVAAFRETARLT
jgi:hypothetical protein